MANHHQNLAKLAAKKGQAAHDLAVAQGHAVAALTSTAPKDAAGGAFRTLQVPPGATVTVSFAERGLLCNLGLNGQFIGSTAGTVFPLALKPGSNKLVAVLVSVGGTWAIEIDLMDGSNPLDTHKDASTTPGSSPDSPVVWELIV